jgi:hypothetical protein
MRDLPQNWHNSKMEKDLFQNHKLNVECVQEAIEKIRMR